MSYATIHPCLNTPLTVRYMSPISPFFFSKCSGVIIWDKPLILRSLRNELLSILTCWVLGFLIAAATYWTTMADSWPTSEMYSRGNKTSMLAGLPVAFVSGMGVAFSILDDNVSGVVGKNVCPVKNFMYCHPSHFITS